MNARSLASQRPVAAGHLLAAILAVPVAALALLAAFPGAVHSWIGAAGLLALGAVGLWLAGLASIEVGRRALGARDPLTGAFDERFLAARIEEETLRARRYGTPLALVIVDPSREPATRERKKQAIRLAEAIRASARETDLVARLRRGELVVLCPHTGALGATVLGERIHDAVEAPSQGREPGLGPLAMGISDLERAGGRSLLEATLEALRNARGNGRSTSIGGFERRPRPDGPPAREG